MTVSYEEMFSGAKLPEQVFAGEMATYVWLEDMLIALSDATAFLVALVQMHADEQVFVQLGDRVLTFDASSLEATWGDIDHAGEYMLLQLWGSSGEWAIQRRICLSNYDAKSWDPATETTAAADCLTAMAHAVLGGERELLDGLREIVAVLDSAPKQLRRCQAADELRAAADRTHYLLLGDARAAWGPLLLEQNDRNHARHAEQERDGVRDALLRLIAHIVPR